MPSSIFTKFIPTSSLNRNSKLTGKKSYFFIRVLLWSERSSMKWKNSWLYQFKLWHTLKLLMNTFCRSLSPLFSSETQRTESAILSAITSACRSFTCPTRPSSLAWTRRWPPRFTTSTGTCTLTRRRTQISTTRPCSTWRTTASTSTEENSSS